MPSSATTCHVDDYILTGKHQINLYLLIEMIWEIGWCKWLWRCFEPRLYKQNKSSQWKKSYPKVALDTLLPLRCESLFGKRNTTTLEVTFWKVGCAWALVATRSACMALPVSQNIKSTVFLHQTKFLVFGRYLLDVLVLPKNVQGMMRGEVQGSQGHLQLLIQRFLHFWTMNQVELFQR